MARKERAEAGETDGQVGAESLPIVNAHALSTERTVFSEEGSEDGWISTDLTVDIRP